MAFKQAKLTENEKQYYFLDFLNNLIETLWLILKHKKGRLNYI